LTGLPASFRIEYKGLPEEYDAGLFLARLREYLEAEIRSGQNLFGPHRDDFNVYKDGELNIYSSSRGELRAQILAVKLLQGQYLTVGEDRPVFILDDVFSELDERRRQLLLAALAGHQVFITATGDQEARRVPDAKIIRIKDNRIVR
jgi:DNA replication and repair protein RecF